MRASYQLFYQTKTLASCNSVRIHVEISISTWADELLSLVSRSADLILQEPFYKFRVCIKLPNFEVGSGCINLSLVQLVNVPVLTLQINFRHIKPLYCSRPNYGYTTTFRNYFETYIMPTAKHTTVINNNIFIALTNISRCLLICSPCYRSQRAILRRFRICHRASRRLPFRRHPDAKWGVGLLLHGGSSM